MNRGKTMGVLGALGSTLALGLCGCSGGLQGWRFSNPPPLAKTEHGCHDTTFPIYFDRGSDQLTMEARTLISSVGQQMQACRVTAAEVVGLAASGGRSLDADAELSRRRADSVARALTASRLPIPKNDLVVEGGVQPVARELLRRRTEVTIHVTPS